jgi:hypothetical protein
LYNGTAGSKYLEYNPGSELTIFSFEQRTMKSKDPMKTKVEKKMNKTQMKIEQQQQKSNNNNKILHDITGTQAMHNIHKPRVSLLNRLKCDRPALHRAKKNILVIMELIITTLFGPVLIVRYPLCLPSKVVHKNPSCNIYGSLQRH